MKGYKYILEPYSGIKSRYRCPECQKGKTFSLYIDSDTGHPVHPTVGKCSRLVKCGFHYSPKQYFQDNSISFDANQPKEYKPRPVTPQQKPVSFIPVELLTASRNPKGFESNNFVKNLITLFGVEVTSEVVNRYFIGTSKHKFRNADFPNYISETGATVFWQIDVKGKIRTGKIMLYNPLTGKRIKQPFNHISWVHKAINQPEFNLKQCFFGEHLLIDKTKPVAIVESEKTAIIASIYLPQFVWVAFGGIGFNIEKFSILKGRKITLFPDLNAFEKWNTKAKELSTLAEITVSDLLERKASEVERKQGLDLADYLIRFPISEFIEPESKPIEQAPTVSPERIFKPEPIPQPQSWSKEITELETYFASIALPNDPIRLNYYTTITNCKTFLSSHLETIKANNGKTTFLPYLNRLNNLRTWLNPL